MNVFEFAMKMEKDGQKYYESQSAKEKNPALKKIWQQLAADEVKHYEIFRKMRDGEVKAASEMAKLGTEILNTAQNVFQQLSTKNQEFSFGEDVVEAWEKAQDIEIETEEFYRQKAQEESDESVSEAFQLLADEENKHVHLIEHVLDFLQQPKSWLEDAEWSNIGSY